jgi:hypothetical protein
MWVLLISLYLPHSLGHVQSKGLIHAPQQSYELCLKARDRVEQTWHMDGYRISSRCVYVRHYSEHNGAYNRDLK